MREDREATAKLTSITAVAGPHTSAQTSAPSAKLLHLRSQSNHHQLGYILSGLALFKAGHLCAAGYRWRCSLHTESFFLTFPLEKRHDGFHSLDVSSAHWHRPVHSRLPSFKCICSLHSWVGNGSLTQPWWALSNYNFLQIQAQLNGHIVNKRLTSGLVRQQHCGKCCVTCSGQRSALFLNGHQE